MNVGLTARIARRQSNEKWVRDVLPDLAVRFAGAAHRFEVAVFEVDWLPLSDQERQDLGMDDAADDDALDLVQKMEVFASPETVKCAHEVIDAIDQIRFVSFDLIESKEYERGHPKLWHAYWEYREAAYAFNSAVRSEMGLKSAPLPIGLVRWRKENVPPLGRWPEKT
ncbi:MAG: hypothetical protein ACTHKL_29135 [Streptosporangiaceae bacterium]